MYFFKTVAVAAAALMAASPVMARGHNGGGGGGSKGGSGQSASRNFAKPTPSRSMTTQRTPKANFAAKQTRQRVTQASSSKALKNHTTQHAPKQLGTNKLTGNHPKPNPLNKPNKLVSNHQKPYPNHMKPGHIQAKWHIKAGTTKYHWAPHHFKFYKDSWGHYYNASNRCWFDGSRSYCGSLPFRYIAGFWYYGEYKWYRTSYGWKCDAPEPPACDTCQTAYVAPAPKPVCQTCQAPAPAPEPVCDTCQAPPAPEPVQQPCETCQLPPPPCETCETQDSL